MSVRDPKPADASIAADPATAALLERVASALERLAPPPPARPDFDAADAFIWQSEPEAFLPVAKVNRVPIALLKSVEQMKDTLLANTERFARGLPANNALLWGARGMGKSSLVKAVHAAVLERLAAAGGKVPGLKLVVGYCRQLTPDRVPVNRENARRVALRLPSHAHSGVGPVK